MSTAKILGRITLTRAQYDALATAVAMADNEWEQDGEPIPRGRVSLNGAWDKIRTAWNSA